MGGKCLLHLGVERKSLEQYAAIANDVTNILHEMNELNPKTAWGFPNFIFGKSEFGDLDIILSNTYRDQVTEYLKKAFNTRGLVKNGQVTSIEYQNFQVDLIFVPAYAVEWSVNWYSYGDTAASLGRVFRYYGFKLKNDGLYFNIKTKSFAKDFYITSNWKNALAILDYSPLKQDYLYTVDDINNYVCSSKFIHKSIYSQIKAIDRNSRQSLKDTLDFILNNQSVPESGPSQKFGWKLLQTFCKPVYQEVLFTYCIFQLKELYLPLKRLRRKLWFKTVRPKLVKTGILKDVYEKRNHLRGQNKAD